MKITNSKVKAFQHCRREYHYKFDQGIVPKIAPLPMKRGTWLHELLEAHYLHDNWRKRLKELKREYDRMFDEEKEYYGDLPEICENIMQAYEYTWRDEDSKLTVIAAEEEVQVKLPHGHLLAFKFDMIAEDEYGRWLWENKSHRAIPSSDYRFIDSQTNIYVKGLQTVKKYGDIVGVCWNYLKTTPPTVPKITQKGVLSKRKINTDVFTFLRALKNYGLDPRDYRDDILRLKGRNDFFRRERVPTTPKVANELVKGMVYIADEIERGYKPVRSISRDCEHCSYKDICMVELYGGDSSMIRKAKFRDREEGEYHGADESQVIA